MLILIAVLLVSTAGWLISGSALRSAAKRHLLLVTVLFACLLLPVLMLVRTGTDWTLLAIPDAVPDLNVDPSSQAMRGSTTSTVLDDGVFDGRALTLTADASTEPEPSPSTTAQTTELRPLDDSSSRVAPAVDGSQTRWDVWLTAVYVAVVAWMLCRLLFELFSLGVIKRRATCVEHLSNNIRVLEADVAVPLAIGFGDHSIVLPKGLRQTLSADQLQDVLAHESEHLRRGDHRIMLVQGVTAAFYWPIVTIHLLNRSLTRAREELCDNAVLAGRSPEAYGETLLAVARQVSSRQIASARLAARMIRRGELERRVAGLLDGRRDRSTGSARSGRWTAALALTIASLLFCTTRVVAVSAESPVAQQEANDAEPQDESQANNDIQWTEVPTVDPDNPTLHRGVVLGPDGQPVSGASVYAASTIELFELAEGNAVGVDDLGPVRAVTDDAGRFEFKASDLSWVTSAGERKRWETLLVVNKDGFAPGWLKTWGQDRSLRSHWHPSKSRQVSVRLSPPSVLTGELTFDDGQPLANARVRLVGLMAPIQYDLDLHIPKEEEDPLGLFESIDYAESLWRPWVLPNLTVEVSTNEAGRFELPGLPEGFIARIEVTHPEAVTFQTRVAIREIEPVYRKPFGGRGEDRLTLYGSGFKAELARCAVLRGRVTSGFFNGKPIEGVLVAAANQNAKVGWSGQSFTTDADGRFEVSGLRNRPEGFDLAFVGSFDAPVAGRRVRVVPGEDARIELQPATRYRLKLVDAKGDPIDREVFSVQVQKSPGSIRHDPKSRFNDAERVAPGVYHGIVPQGPAAVLIKRGAKRDRPASVDPKAYFEPGRNDWTLEERRHAYGDQWRIARPSIVRHSSLSPGGNWSADQLEFAAIVFTNERAKPGNLELTATVRSDPPVQFNLVDEAGDPVQGCRLDRQLNKYNGKDLPSTIKVYGLHPERAEFLVFKHEERGLIGTASAVWTDEPVRVVLRPAATIVGRFTKQSGQIDRDFSIRFIGDGIPPDTVVGGRVFQLKKTRGRRKGEFILTVPPSMEVRGEFVRKTSERYWRPSAGDAFGPLVPKAGETVDLGDLVVP